MPTSPRAGDPDAAVLAASVGLTFADPELFLRAITHSSFAAEHGGEDYERLEFLGDSVLSLVVSEFLHESFPQRPEGDLTRMRTSVVRGGVLADAARDIGVPDLVRLGRGATRAGDRDRASVLEAVFEAISAAVYLDGGLEAARGFILGALGSRLRPEVLLAELTDPKTRLQEATQARGLGLPSYEVVSEGGPAHERCFMVEAVLGGRVLGHGSGHTKQAAAQAAAAEALNSFE
ncbi:MAG: ribonuclease III [Coriobacteriia bacterium]|nr:ribonuclease III [Coriobacteriia bacterium]